MRIVVATVVHHPEDARIRHRQIPTLLKAGHEVVYVAPPGDAKSPPPGLERVVVPRAAGRNRLRALGKAAVELWRVTADADLTLVHDPELTVLDRFVRSPMVWDVHEDVVAQVADKAYIPGRLRPFARTLAERVEQRGRRRLDCLIAEVGYRSRFPDATLVRNTVHIPDDVVSSGDSRVVYLGRVSHGRGAAAMAALGRTLPAGANLEIIGPVDDDVFGLAGPGISVHGFVPNDDALALLPGAAVGLSLLQDRANYRHSMPTKLLEYLAHGVPVVSTPLSEAVALVEGYDCGVVVPFDDDVALHEAVGMLLSDAELRHRLAANGRRIVSEKFNWSADASRFVDRIERAAHS